MSFATVVNCMDGRVQLPVLDYARERFGVQFVDAVTEAGPVGVLAFDPTSSTAEAIFSRVDISIQAHGSKGIVVVAHDDCVGNPRSPEEQRKQLRASVALLAERYEGVEVAGAWVDDSWMVAEVFEGGGGG